MDFIKYTEQDSNHNDLEKKSIGELLRGMHQEDQAAVAAVGKVLLPLNSLIEQVVKKMQQGGRLFYIGAGTSGRLGVLDASECPPTFGIDPGKVVGLIAVAPPDSSKRISQWQKTRFSTFWPSNRRAMRRLRR